MKQRKKLSFGSALNEQMTLFTWRNTSLPTSNFANLICKSLDTDTLTAHIVDVLNCKKSSQMSVIGSLDLN